MLLRPMVSPDSAFFPDVSDVSFFPAAAVIAPLGASTSVNSFWVWAQAESVITFMASFSDHSVQGFSFWAEALTVNKMNTEQSNRIFFMDGLLLGKLVYYGFTGYAHLRGNFRLCLGGTTVIIK